MKHSLIKNLPLILETPIEFFDAYYEGWGFSVSDMVANALGSLFFIYQQTNNNNKNNKLFNKQYYIKGLVNLLKTR